MDSCKILYDAYPFEKQCIFSICVIFHWKAQNTIHYSDVAVIITDEYISIKEKRNKWRRRSQI